MSSLASPDLNPGRTARERRLKLNAADLRANRILRYTAITGGSIVFITLVAVLLEVLTGAFQSIGKEGVGFVTHTTWVPAIDKFGGLAFIYGSLVTSVVGVFFATILGVSIGLFLALLAPPRVAQIIGPLVEMLAAVPSVVLGLIGITLIAPFNKSTIEPAVHSVLGWLPIFSSVGNVGNSLFCAALVLTIMVVPIIAALTRDTFLTVPRELRDGAEALGATRWEMIRGVVLPTTKSGIIAACVLGFARAIEEAIAVTQVVGNDAVIHANLFTQGDTIGSVLAGQFGDPFDNLHKSSLLYLALILLIIGFATNLLARRIALGSISGSKK